jgi:hemoglobin-like flavoprotein
MDEAGHNQSAQDSLAAEAWSSVMNPSYIALINRSFEQLARAAEEVAAAFYRRLFELDPTLRPLFQHDIALQGRKFMTMLAVVVRGLDALDRLLADVENLGRRHVAYGVSDTHYETVEAALLWAIQDRLGAEWTPAVGEAWAAAYRLLAAAMQRAAGDVPGDALVPAPDLSKPNQ